MTARAFPCAVCGEVLMAQTDTTEDPEAPELVRFDTRWQGGLRVLPWIGIVGTIPPTLLVLCSSDCKKSFFKAGG